MMALFSNSSSQWDRAVRHLTTKYKYQEVGDTYKLVFELGGSRDQLVFVSKAGNKNAGDWVSITSPIGDVSEIKGSLRELLEECGTNVCGAPVVIGDLVLLRHSFPASSYTSEDFDWALQAVTATADQLERRFTGGNKY